MEQEFNVYKKLSEVDSQIKYAEVSMVHLLVGNHFLSSRITPFGTWEWIIKVLPHLCSATGRKKVAVASNQ